MVKREAHSRLLIIYNSKADGSNEKLLYTCSALILNNYKLLSLFRFLTRRYVGGKVNCTSKIKLDKAKGPPISNINPDLLLESIPSSSMGLFV